MKRQVQSRRLLATFPERYMTEVGNTWLRCSKAVWKIAEPHTDRLGGKLIDGGGEIFNFRECLGGVSTNLIDRYQPSFMHVRLDSSSAALQRSAI